MPLGKRMGGTGDKLKQEMIHKKSKHEHKVFEKHESRQALSRSTI